MAQENENYTRKLRPRRSALGDISNKITEKITDVAKKVSKKRKSSGSNDGDAANTSVNSTEPVDATANPIAAPEESDPTSSMKKKLRSSAAKEREAAKEKENSAAKEKERETTVEEKQFSNKIQRTFPLRPQNYHPKHCYDMLDSMYELYYENEDKYAAKPYMVQQEDLNNKMRSILVDWLVEVHHKFKLQTSTLWLCVNILDRYLSIVQIKRGKLQLVGIAAFFIACKFEEVHPPDAGDFVHITDNAYTRGELLKMETDVLNKLNYEVLVPTGYHFFARYLNAVRASENVRLLASYYAERNLQEPHMLDVKPRVFAAAAVYAALRQQNDRYPCKLGAADAWGRQLQEESNLVEADLIECARRMIKHVKEEPITTSKRKLIAAKKKYLMDKYDNVARLDLPDI